MVRMTWTILMPRFLDKLVCNCGCGTFQIARGGAGLYAACKACGGQALIGERLHDKEGEEDGDRDP